MQAAHKYLENKHDNRYTTRNRGTRYAYRFCRLVNWNSWRGRDPEIELREKSLNAIAHRGAHEEVGEPQDTKTYIHTHTHRRPRPLRVTVEAQVQVLREPTNQTATILTHGDMGSTVWDVAYVQGCQPCALSQPRRNGTRQAHTHQITTTRSPHKGQV